MNEIHKDLIFNKSSKILMVEGETDAEYFRLLKDSGHGRNALNFDVEIFAYGDKDNLKNMMLLKFIKNKYRRLFITFDLNAMSSVTQSLESLDLKDGIDFCSIGKKATAADNIEGLLPTSIKSVVNASNTDLITQLGSTESKKRNSAKQQLKNKYLAEFKSKAVPGEEFYSELYKVTRIINIAFR